MKNICLAFFLFTAFSLSYNDAMAQMAFSDPVDQVVEGGGGLAAVEADVDAGTIPIGSTAQVIVRFRNESGRPIEFRDINLYPSSTVSASVGVNQCSAEPLAGGAECAVIVAVKGLQPGAWRTEMLVRHTGRSRLVTARINGTVESGDTNVNTPTDLEVNPNPVDFGTLEASRPIIRSLTIRNITSNPIDIKDMFIDAPKQSGYNLRSDCTQLASGQACIASILWSPIIQGPSSGFLVIEHSGSSAVANIPLTGTFNPGESKQAEVFPASLPGKGVLVSSETEIDFEDGINAQSAITISLVNVGDNELTLNKIQLAGSENGLKILATGCQDGMVLSATEACPLTVSWAPTKVGSVIDDVQISHTGARGILVLPIRGTAAEAISVDSKPIIVSRDGLSGEASVSSSSINGTDGQPVLDGYVVTSHSSNHAIIKGPVGSRIVTDGKTTLIGGYEWRVHVTEEGVRLISGDTIVILVFDRSLNNMNGTTTSSRGTNGGVTPSSSASSSSSGGSQ